VFALDPIDEFQKIQNWTNRLENLSLTPLHFIQRLGQFLNKSHPITVQLHDGDLYGLNPRDFCISAEYDPHEDQLGLKCFKFDFIINHPKNQIYIWDQDKINDLNLQLCESLVHEYQHQKQFQSRKFKTKSFRYSTDSVDQSLIKEQQHYAHPDELEAYATNIATRIFLLRKILNTCVDVQESLDYQHYLTLFGSRHHVVCTLYSQIQQNLKSLEELANGKIPQQSRRSSSRSRRLPK